MVYTQQYIDQMFTQTVSEFMSQGYQIHPATMHTGFSDLFATVDLFNADGEMIRVWIETFPSNRGKPAHLRFFVGHCYHKPANSDRFYRLFSHSFNPHEERMEILFACQFASITADVKDSPFFVDMATGRKMEEKRIQRRLKRLHALKSEASAGGEL